MTFIKRLLRINMNIKTILTLLVGLLVSAYSLNAEIKKNTVIQISILGVPPSDVSRINATYSVDSSGNIRMWEIGTIRAAGLDQTTLCKKIEDAYVRAQIYTKPTIQIQAENEVDNLQKLVTVTGSVNRPAAIPYVHGMTLASALATVGGPSTFGTTKRVTVWRSGKKYDLSPLTNEKHKFEKVFPDDVIEVDQVKAWEKGGE